MGSSYLPPPEQNVVNVGDELSQSAIDAINAASFPSGTNPFRTLSDGGAINAYDNFKTYQAGDLVIEANKIYRFNSYIGAAGYGPITHPSAWTEISAFPGFNNVALTGNCTAPTPPTADNDTSIATTAFVKGQGYAQLSGATFNGSVIIQADNSNTVLRLPIYDSPVPIEHGDIWISSTGNLSYGVVEYFEGEPNRIPYQIARMADLSFYAPKQSPTFTGNPTAPTPATSDNDTSIATTAFVKAQNYLTSSALTPYARLDGATFTGNIALSSPISSQSKLSVIATGINTYTTDVGHSSIRVGFLNFQEAFGYLSSTEAIVGGNNSGNIMLTTSGTAGFEPVITINNIGSSKVTYIKNGKFLVNDNQGDPDYEPYLTSANLNLKADLSGATFTGKVNMTSVSGAAGINIGIGGVQTTATTPGDMWIATGGTLLNYRDATGSWRQILTTSQTGFIDTSSSTAPAFRVTQRGTAPSFIVEDSTTPDTSSLVVDASGNVGIGVASGYTSTSKVEVVGNVKADTFSNGSGPTFSINSTGAHTGGSDTLDLLVTINGVNYRIGLRPA